jgi:hypothetical protein
MALKRWAPALLALPVLLIHLGAGELIHRWDEGWRTQAALPARIDVAFVRELKPALLHPGRVKVQKPVATGVVPVQPEGVLPLPSLSALDVPPPPEPVASAVASEDGEPGPEWPLSTRLDYLLTGNYRGAVTGSAKVEWLRQGAHYQVRLELSLGGLVSRSMVSDGVLTAHGIEPRRYDEETRILLMAPRRVNIRFDGSRLTLSNGSAWPQPFGVQDSASQFVHLTWLFLTGRKPMQAGTRVDLPLALPRRVYDWRYEVQGEESVQTRMGLFKAWHLQPTRAELAPLNGDLSAEVWLAPTLQYLPVRILIRQDAQNFIDLTLDKPPLQADEPAAPQSSPEHPQESHP